MSVRLILLLARRDRLFQLMVAALVGVALLARFVGDSALVEGGATTLSLAGYVARWLVVAGVVLFTVLQMRRLFDTQIVLVMLSQPVSRAGLVLKAAVGFALVALALALAAAVCVAAAGWPQTDPAGVLAWAAGLSLEAMLMAVFAVFCAVSMRSAVAAMVVAFAFNGLARFLGVMIAITQSDFRQGTAVNAGLEVMVDVLGFVLPRLDAIAPTRWLYAGPPGLDVLAFLGAQAALYLLLVYAAAVFDFRRLSP